MLIVVIETVSCPTKTLEEHFPPRIQSLKLFSKESQKAADGFFFGGKEPKGRVDG